MKSALTAILVFVQAASAGPSAGFPPGRLLADSLVKKMDSAVGGKFGISLYSLKYGRYELQINDTAFFTPASCLKLVVTAAALDCFPENHFPETILELKGRKTGRTFKGRVILDGHGDPNISSRYFPSETSVLEAWADSVAALGIDTILGSVTAIDTFFTGPRTPPEWKSSHFDKWYGAEISALTFNDNCYNLIVEPGKKAGDTVSASIVPDIGYTTLQVRALTVPGNKSKLKVILHPDSNLVVVEGTLGVKAPAAKRTCPVRNATEYFRTALEWALKKRGIVLPGGTAGEKDSPLLHRWSMKTVPLTNIVEDVNQRSQNLHAEITLRLLGRQAGGNGSAESGISAEKAFLAGAGIDTSSLVLADGCGLSDINRVTPLSITRLLTKMARHKAGSDYIRSLATPGLHGVRAWRLSHLEGLVKMKTGYIDNVQGLCGYIFTPGNDTLAVSMFLNDYKGAPRPAAGVLDSLMTLLAHWYNREQPSLEKADALLSDPAVPKSYFDRLLYFSKKLEGAPYLAGPTGEGRFADIDAAPLLNLEAFDCVTYIEHVMALASCSSATGLIENLNGIRYLDSLPSFQSRKHFFIQDWVYGSPRDIKVLRFPGDTTASRTMGKKMFFGLKGLPWNGPEPITEISYVPVARAIEMMDNWTFGRRFIGVGFVTSRLDWLWVTHTGFLDATEERPLLRHASLLGKKVTSEDFKTYLENQKSRIAGVFFFDFQNRD